MQHRPGGRGRFPDPFGRSDQSGASRLPGLPVSGAKMGCAEEKAADQRVQDLPEKRVEFFRRSVEGLKSVRAGIHPGLELTGLPEEPFQGQLGQTVMPGALGQGATTDGGDRPGVIGERGPHGPQFRGGADELAAKGFIANHGGPAGQGTGDGADRLDEALANVPQILWKMGTPVEAMFRLECGGGGQPMKDRDLLGETGDVPIDRLVVFQTIGKRVEGMQDEMAAAMHRAC